MLDTHLYVLEGSVLAFLGTDGLDGVLEYYDNVGWRLHVAGSSRWDALHQGVFRNGKGRGLTAEALPAMGVPAPPVQSASELPPPVTWASNFAADRPLAEAPAALTKRVADAGGTMEVFLVLEEDRYESAFGDGRFLYPVAAFWEAEPAAAFVAGRAAPATDRYAAVHTVKSVRLWIDDAQGVLRADLGLRSFEHYDIDDVISRLSGGETG